MRKNDWLADFIMYEICFSTLSFDVEPSLILFSMHVDREISL